MSRPSSLACVVHKSSVSLICGDAKNCSAEGEPYFVSPRKKIKIPINK
jgi:hypothetical protein